MADKNPQRCVVPLFCTQPTPQPMDLEDNIFYFPPIRVAELESRYSPYRSQQPSQGITARHREPNEENIPPPSTQPRHCPEASTPVETAALGGCGMQATASTQRGSKVNCLYFSNDPHH